MVPPIPELLQAKVIPPVPPAALAVAVPSSAPGQDSSVLSTLVRLTAVTGSVIVMESSPLHVFPSVAVTKY